MLRGKVKKFKSAEFLFLTCKSASFYGLATDYVTDAALKSAKTLRWEKVKKVK